MAISFFSRCEGTTLSATDDLPGSDTSAALNGTAAINGTAALAGANGLQILAAGDTYRVDSETGIIDRMVGSLAFLFRVQTWANGASLCYVRGSSFDQNFMVLMLGSSGSGNLRFRINDQGAGQTTLDLSGNAIALNTTYYADISWDIAANDRRIRLYDFAGGTLLDSAEDLTTALTAPADLVGTDGVRLGESAGIGSPAYYLDNFFIGKAYADADAFLANRAITSYTQYGGGAQHDPFVTVQFR
jgi:hypothetical protein